MSIQERQHYEERQELKETYQDIVDDEVAEGSLTPPMLWNLYLEWLFKFPKNLRILAKIHEAKGEQQH